MEYVNKMHSASLDRKYISIQCVCVYIFICHFVVIYAIDWHTCLNTSDDIHITSSMQKCQDKCQSTTTCTAISFCRQVGMCHIVSLPLEGTVGAVNNTCPGCVLVYRKDMSQLQDLQHDADGTENTIVACNINIRDFEGCQIKGNMYHEGHLIKVNCIMLQYLCRNATFVCGRNGVWTFVQCVTPIAASNNTCVSNIAMAERYTNVALGKPVSMSSHHYQYYDGRHIVDRHTETCADIYGGEGNQHMTIDLEKTYTIYAVYIYGISIWRYNNKADFNISFGQNIDALYPRFSLEQVSDWGCTLILDSPVQARYVKLNQEGDGYSLFHVCEFEIYTIVEL